MKNSLQKRFPHLKFKKTYGEKQPLIKTKRSVALLREQTIISPNQLKLDL